MQDVEILLGQIVERQAEIDATLIDHRRRLKEIERLLQEKNVRVEASCSKMHMDGPDWLFYGLTDAGYRFYMKRCGKEPKIFIEDLRIDRAAWFMSYLPMLLEDIHGNQKQLLLLKSFIGGRDDRNVLGRIESDLSSARVDQADLGGQSSDTDPD